MSAMATDGWQQTRAVVVEWWRSRRPDRADDVGSDLEAARTQVLAAREQGDEDTEQALAGAWRLRFQQLLSEDPALADELRLLLNEHLAPALSDGEQTQDRPIIMKAEARDNSRVYLAGRDQHITGP
ncbi:hypothetical protein GCM10018790_64860 [Kitasatospora xanthocidica]|uniref:hypothetical protein n=1 Tax=Kitasatospora xanthocidica TaxID=83382 RepID=UPI0016787030|nr:hypothetical protein [Kitasatospora xanthocidica]GHF77766.1 hypothetical protein GCM10018790_64860 [Kitasatospora xanthocidica]